MKNISIIGTGYVGIVTGVCLAEKGFNVNCIDIDNKKIDLINKGIPPIYEEGLETLLKKNVVNGRLIASNDLDQAIKKSDMSIITVGTPFDGKRIDLIQVKNSARGIGEALKQKKEYHVVVVKSTVIPGTTDNVVLPILEEYSGKKAGRDLGIGMNPEFLREGCAVGDFMNPDRIVIGGIDKKTTDTISDLYRSFSDTDIIITNNATAEMIKYASNSLLATLISFSNEIANICSVTPGTDIKDVMMGVHLDKRLNPILADGNRANPGFLSYLEAGCGFGGSCFPKDVKAFISYAKDKEENPRLLQSVIEINSNQPNRLIHLLRRHYQYFNDLTVSVLGIAFKPGTDDVRESPSIEVIKALLLMVKCIKIYDPLVQEYSKKLFNTNKIVYSESLKSAIDGVDVIIIITRWDEFSNIPDILNAENQHPLIIDGRRLLDKNTYAFYEGIGLNQQYQYCNIDQME